MIKNYTGDYTLCVQLADEFYSVAQCVAPDPFDMYEWTAYPYAVNISFACELYLKALSIRSGENHEFKGTHDLYHLFHSLSVSVQNTIKSNYEDSRYRDNLEQFLIIDREVFVDWRYPFVEGQKSEDLYFTDFQLFAEALRKAIMEISIHD